MSAASSVRDLLECMRPAALEAAKQPFRSTMWVAAMTVVKDRDGGDRAPAGAWARPVRARGA